MENTTLSFIIPTYNEQGFLPGTLESIATHVPVGITYEIIVADNGSSDETVAIAERSGAQVVVDESATVGGLRNRAVARAKGDVFVFLDADVQITEAWGENIIDCMTALDGNPWQLTGSRCGIPENAGWIESCWFRPMLGKQGNYINSGHLIAPRALFEKIGGFDENLETGEDYALSVAAVAENADINPNAALKVVHGGYPKTLGQFMRREIWHGKGDCKPLSAMLRSKVAVFSMLFGLAALVSLTAFLLSMNPAWLALLGGLGLVCVAAALFKHRVRSPGCVAAVSMLYACYFLSRFLSCAAVRLPAPDAARHR